MAGYSAPEIVDNWAEFPFLITIPPASVDALSGTSTYQAVQTVPLSPTVRFASQASGTYYGIYRLLPFLTPAPVIIDRVVFQTSFPMQVNNAKIGIVRYPAGFEAFTGGSNPIAWANTVAGPSPFSDFGVFGGIPGTTGVINASGSYNSVYPGLVYEMAITSDNYNSLDAGDNLYLVISSPSEDTTGAPDRLRLTLRGRYVP